MAYRLADPSVTHALETRHRMDAESGEFHFLLQRPRRPEAKRPEGRLDAVMAMVALSAPVWCPIATYLCARFGGDGSADLGSAFAGVLGLAVGVGVAATALCHGVLKPRR